MPLIEQVPVDFSHLDERGSLIQLLHKDFSQVNVLRSNAGVTRGGHYHKVSKERFFIVSGNVEVTACKDDISEKYVFAEGDYFEVVPYVIHSMYFPKDCIMVQMYDIPVERSDGSKDIYAAEDVG